MFDLLKLKKELVKRIDRHLFDDEILLQFKKQGSTEKLENAHLYFSVNQEGKIHYTLKTKKGDEIYSNATDLDASEFYQVNTLSSKEKRKICTAAAKNYHAGNTIKKEFDFVLQFRFEVEGGVSPVPIQTLARYMQNYGITCDEYVGKTDALGKTPITFQMMITKEHYQLLEKFAKSGSPVKPFSGTDEERMKKVPDLLMQQLKGYLGLRLRHFTQKAEIVSLDKATISVNEAPATYAKKVYTEIVRNGKARRVLLLGDAGLGLSYFKGINAGFEASARVLPELVKPYNLSKKGLESYQQWFESEYAPQKVSEVRNFSVFRIGLLVGFFKTLQFLFRSDFFMRGETADKTVDLMWFN